MRKYSKTHFGDHGAFKVSFSMFGHACWDANVLLTPLLRKYSKTHFGDPGAFQASFSRFGQATWDVSGLQGCLKDVLGMFRVCVVDIFGFLDMFDVGPKHA